MENVLQNMNKLNRSLEGVIAVRSQSRAAYLEHLADLKLLTKQVGNEFSQVEGLWSQFENVMAKPAGEKDKDESKEGAAEEQQQQ